MATPVPVIRRGEIYLGGTYFPAKGKVRVANISVTPNPIAFGDTSKQGDTQVMSQLIQTSVTAGLGIYKGNPRTDTERFWTSTSETRYRNQICLPPLTYVMGKPASISTQDPILTHEYQNIQYFVWAGGLLYRWNDASATFSDNGTVINGWSSLLATLSGNPTDACIFKDYLYFAEDTNTQKMVLSGGSESLSAVAGASNLLVVWDEKLWKLYTTSGVWTTASTPSGGASGEVWTTGGIFPSGITPTKLMTFRNVSGDEVLAALTTVGLWLYDATTAKWRQTEVRIPPMPFGEKSVGEIFRDGKLYVTSGSMGVISIQSGNPFIIAPVGLDRDDGVPAVESGKVVSVRADFNWLFALLDGTSTVGADDTMWSGLGGPFDTPEWSSASGVLTLKTYNSGWHTLWQSDGAATPGYILDVSSAYTKRRVYWGSSGQIYCIDLPVSVYNPRFNPTPKFAVGPTEHVSSWFDYGSDVQDKIQAHFFARTTTCTSTETVTVYYQLDLDETVWTLLGSITSNGMTTLKPGDVQGIQCQMIRFKFVFSRGTSAALTPRLEFWAADFLKVLPATYAFVVTIDLSKAHRKLTPAALSKALRDLANPAITEGMIPFSYIDELDTEPQTHYGRISRLQGQAELGIDLRGQGWYQLSFMVPYLGDSV